MLCHNFSPVKSLAGSAVPDTLGSAGAQSEDLQSEEVRALLQAVPEFTPRYLGLVEEADGHPGNNEAFSELADFVAELASGLEQFRPLLVRCLSAIERVAEVSEDAEELVGWCFLDYLSLDARRAVIPWLGPSTLSILETIEDP
jgi:hypothetical protein